MWVVWCTRGEGVARVWRGWRRVCLYEWGEEEEVARRGSEKREQEEGARTHLCVTSCCVPRGGAHEGARRIDEKSTLNELGVY